MPPLLQTSCAASLLQFSFTAIAIVPLNTQRCATGQEAARFAKARNLGAVQRDQVNPTGSEIPHEATPAGKPSDS